MDNRKALCPGDVLCFPGMECEIEKTVGKGSNAIVYLGRYRDAVQTALYHHVLIKELFPYSEDSLITRNDDNSLSMNDKGREHFDLQRLSFECGNQIHLSMLEQYPDRIGSNINTFNLNNTLYTVMGFDAGKSMDKYFLGRERTLKSIGTLMLDALDAVDVFHKAGYLHLDISPDNILIIGDTGSPRISLIDYNTVHRKEEIKSGTALYCSAKEGYTAPELSSGDISLIGESTDVYSLTAIFYWLITGKPLTLYQRLCKNPPDIRNVPVMKDVQDTVYYQVMLILKRGLSTVVSKRYKNCESMKKDIEELICRIDSIGITHASVWEAGKRTVSRMIKSNPSLQYLTSEECFPIRVVSQGERLSVNEAFDRQLGKGSAVLCGGAGMGKTTTLLQGVISNSRSYSPLQAACVYVSLFDYNDSGENFIKNRILEDLKFDKSIRDMESARNILVKTFDESIKVKNGERARYLLLIDGFNEADGDTQPLIKEIISLSELDGVCVVVTTRNKTERLPFDYLELSPLDENDVRSVLSSHSLVYPESPQMQELLKTPLLLSVFCKTATDSEKQLRCTDAGDLLDAYLSGICEKEMSSLAQDSPRQWLTDASVNFVLPFICAEITRKNKALSDEELLKVVTGCHKLLSSRYISYVLPQYIGHSKDIKCSTENAEQWYGETVVKTLWHKTGLLIKEPGRGYRVRHQVLQEHLLGAYKAIRKRVVKRNVFLSCITAVVPAVLCAAVIFAVNPKPYDELLAESYLDSVVISQVNTGKEITLMRELLDENVSDEEHEVLTVSLDTWIDSHKNLIDKEAVGSAAKTQEICDMLINTGKVMPWSGKAVDPSDAQALHALGDDINENYALYAEILSFLRENDELNEKFGEEFRLRLGEKVEADAALGDVLFNRACLVHLDEMEKKAPENSNYYWLTIGENADLSDADSDNPDTAETEKLKNIRDEKTRALHELEIFVIYRRLNK